ncbi:hypothetical protein Bhyg_04990 [Pseudolycoriella hygida]|uniref:CCHC-type domain-containing protein n=1 Tax=Pseudolycoriella hygida TaxID=35572 RepID=A0A9Q0NGB5_9DIPT|nr:hypothetical protein Bhyg_04990 [Pseudolycoriella hygida]
MIKQKLLDSDSGAKSAEENVFYTSKKPKGYKRKTDFICFSCGGKNHKASDCTSSPSHSSSRKNTTAKVVRSTAFSMKVTKCKRKDDWYVDSGGGRNMTPYGDLVHSKRESYIKEVMTADDTNLEVIDQNDTQNDEFVTVSEINTDNEEDVIDVGQISDENEVSDQEQSHADETIIVINDSLSSSDTVVNESGNESEDSASIEDTFDDQT